MKKGFTLLEVLVAIIVVAILSSIAVMYYGRFIERMRIAEADTLMGTSILAQERFSLKFQRYTPYWHQLDAAPIAVRTPKTDNDFANGKTNTIYYTRGGMLSGEPKAGFAISFEPDATGRWFAVARRVGPGEYTYRVIRPFDSTKSVCVPDWTNDKDLDICIDYMGVEHATELEADPMISVIEGE